MKYQYNFSKWLQLVAVKVSSMDELYEMSIAAFEILHSQHSQTNLKKENANCKDSSMSLPPLVKPPSKRLAKGKTQCRAAKNNKKRCDNSTTNSNELCNIHQNREALDWDDDETDQGKKSVVTDENVNVENGVDDSSISMQPRLKRESNGLIYWPDTIYVVKSLEEAFVVGREDRDGKVQPLDQEDVQYLEESKIPYKVVSLEFTGENRPPRDIMNAELRKLLVDF